MNFDLFSHLEEQDQPSRIIAPKPEKKVKPKATKKVEEEISEESGTENSVVEPSEKPTRKVKSTKPTVKREARTLDPRDQPEPLKLNNADKLYFSIGEVAKLFKVNPSLIRFWEKEFDELKLKKNKKGNRLFTKADLESLNLIYHLVKQRGYTLQGAKEKLKGDKQKYSSEVEVIESLQNIKSFLLQLKEEIS